MCITLGKGMRRTVQTAGAIFALIAFVLLLLSLLTDYWLKIEVNRDVAPALTGGELATYTRNRGLYRECWPDESLQSSMCYLLSMC